MTSPRPDTTTPPDRYRMPDQQPFFTPAEPDPEFPARWQGGHALIVQFGDEEMTGCCQCGYPLGEVMSPAGSLDSLLTPWERHVMMAVAR